LIAKIENENSQQTEAGYVFFLENAAGSLIELDMSENSVVNVTMASHLAVIAVEKT